MRLLAAFLLLWALPGAALAQSRTLSDAEAIQIMNTDWNALTGSLLIGERLVASDTPAGDCKSELISTLQFDFILNAERAGLVTISYWDKRGEFLKEKNYTNKEIIDFAVTGRLQKFTVLPTKEAQTEQLKLEVHNRAGCMHYKPGRYEIGAVTENRPLRKGTTDLAAVNVTYRVDYGQIYLKMSAVAQRKIDSKRKANVLFAFNPSSKRWQIIAFDAANADEEIKPLNIPAAYERLR